MKYDFDSAIDRSSTRCRKWDYDYILSRYKNVPKNFIPFWIADMDFKSAPEIIETFSSIINNGTFGYTYCFNEFYDSVIRFQKKYHNCYIKKEWITLCYGTVSTLHYIIQAFCNKNDCIIMNTPVYDPFYEAATKNGVRVIESPLLLSNNRYNLNFEEIEKILVEKKPKIYLFCSPHNPSGRIWSESEINEIANLCKKYSVIMICDEVHSEHIIQGEFTPSLSIIRKDLLNNLIMLTSPNKAFNLGGLKTSYSIIPSEEIRITLKNQLNKNSITSPNIFGIWGIISSYNHGENWLKEAVNYIKGNIIFFDEYINNHIPNLKMMPVESSYLAWVDITKTKLSSNDFTAKLASDIGVLVENGNHFVSNGEGFVRFNLGTRRDLIKEGLLRMKTLLS